MNSLKRNCPNCNKTIIYSTSSNYNRGVKSNALCYYCANDTRRGRKRTDTQIKRIALSTKKAMANPLVIEKIKLGMSNPVVKRKMSENGKRQMNIMLRTPEDRGLWSEKISIGTKRRWNERTPDERKYMGSILQRGRDSLALKLKDIDYKKEFVKKIMLAVKGKNTKPEIEVKQILENHNIKYEPQYQLETKLYDFYIPQKNLLLEVDGIYWHAKNLPHKDMSAMQIRHRKNDIFKNKLAKQYKYNLIRVWEDEIDEKTLIKRINDI